MGDASESELWRCAGAGDANAFGTLYERHARAIYNYLFRRSGDWSQAEDLTSVVFLEAYRRRDAVIPEGKLLPWLYGIATNVLRNRNRALARHRAALLRMPPPEPVADFSDDAVVRLAAEQEMRVILELVREFRDEEQEALALCVWSELSYEEAAFAVGVPVGTIRSRLSRARTRLRELADARTPEGPVIGEPSAGR